MEKYSDQWNHLNSLLSMLRSAKAVALVERYYALYGNAAPAKLLDEQINVCQADLDKSV